MASPTIGSAVVAVSHNDGKTLYVFGDGIFEGYFLPPSVDVETTVSEIVEQYEKARKVTPDLPDTFTREHARIALILSESNPRIRLDSGEIVWGFECWWSDAETFAEKSKDYTIVHRDINEARAENAKLDALKASMDVLSFSGKSEQA